MFFILLTHFLGVSAPGPSFISVVRNSLVYGLKKSSKFIIAVGISSGIYVCLAMIGIGTGFMEKGIVRFFAYGFGSVYLCYIGIKLIIEKDIIIKKETQGGRSPSFLSGFILGSSNPEAFVFYVSFLSTFISSETSSLVKILWTIWFTISASIYFYIFGAIFAKYRLKALPFIKYMNKFCGILLIFFGFKLLQIGFFKNLI